MDRTVRPHWRMEGNTEPFRSTTPKEVQEIIQRLKNRKDPGKDGVNNRMLRLTERNAVMRLKQAEMNIYAKQAW